MIEASAPGKLFIAGEYAVVTPGHPAILIALNQFITVRLEKAEDEGTIVSAQNGGLPVPWTRQDGQLYIDQRENPFIYITQAINITEQYIKEQGRSLSLYHLSVRSELDNASGKKYGLGSSGAVTIATIKALLKFYQLPYTPLLLFKLGALTHLSVNSNGSFGDIAASSFTGWLAYACFDRQWVLEKQKKYAITELLEMEWPLLMIQRLTPPKDIRLLIGWTGSPASTAHLVDKVNDKRADIDQFYQDFLHHSKETVCEMIQAFKQQNVPVIQQCLRQNRQLLQELSRKTGVVIETRLLQTLCRIAEKYQGAAKSSGAGGGDCGIIILPQQADSSALLSEWEEEGIHHLPLQVYQEA